MSPIIAGITVAVEATETCTSPPERARLTLIVVDDRAFGIKHLDSMYMLFE